VKLPTFYEGGYSLIFRVLLRYVLQMLADGAVHERIGGTRVDVAFCGETESQPHKRFLFFFFFQLGLVEMKQKTRRISALDGFNTFINVLLGTGPILLPPVVAQSGIYLSGLVLLVMGGINFVCSEFVIEVKKHSLM
jgi:hypothetical protein